MIARQSRAWNHPGMGDFPIFFREFADQTRLPSPAESRTIRPHLAMRVFMKPKHASFIPDKKDTEKSAN
jgi:hypothetical protein